MEYNTIEESNAIVSEKNIMFKKIILKRQSLKTTFTNEELNEGIITNFPFPYTYRSYLSLGKNVSTTKFFKRAGVIPYTIINSQKFFCMGIDTKFGSLTDFGGSVRRFETFYGAAARELEEESLGIFNFSPNSIYQNSIAVYDNLNILLMINIKVKDINLIVKDFFTKYQNSNNSENCGLMWIPDYIFYELIHSGKSVRYDRFIFPSIYKPVNDLLKSVNNLCELF